MTRILVADDEHLIRDTIVGLLDLEDDFEVVGRAASGDEALATVLRVRPDVALLDLQLPGPDGIEVTRRLATELPDCRCVIVTSHGRPGYLKSALAAGARGFLPKTVSSRTFAQVVRQVAGGGRYVDPALAAEAISAGDSPLSPREYRRARIGSRRRSRRGDRPARLAHPGDGAQPPRVRHRQARSVEPARGRACRRRTRLALTGFVPLWMVCSSSSEGIAHQRRRHTHDPAPPHGADAPTPTHAPTATHAA